LLHDIGKPDCWANERPFTDHIGFTQKIVESTLGKELATTAMRHHSSRYYESQYHPQTDDEEVICLSDNIASGADRPEEAYTRRPRPKPPISLTHPLSTGKVFREHDRASLAFAGQEMRAILGKNVSIAKDSLEKGYLSIFDGFSKSRFTEIPAHTEAPINDCSLFDHAKLTAAIATCIQLSGGFKGDNPEKYELSLLSGDADKIGAFLDRSRRLPDLIAGSNIVKMATQHAVEVIKRQLGPDCVIYQGGGSFLALSPPNKADEILRETEKTFVKFTDRQLTITTTYIAESASNFKDDFGKIWKSAIDDMRLKKRKRELFIPEFPETEEQLCDQCGERRAKAIDLDYVSPINASPRPEYLCEPCYKRRELGKLEKGISLDSIADKDPNRFIGILKMDGDSMGEIITGETMNRYNKKMTPARLNFVSFLINKICEDALPKIVQDSGGATIFAGGDDLLAVLPGKTAIPASQKLAQCFGEEMNQQATMSAGVILTKPANPLYMSLRLADQLLRNAKDEKSKASLDYEVIYGTGYQPSEIDREKRLKKRDKGLSSKPYSWLDLSGLIELARELKERPTTQLKTLAQILMSTDPRKLERAFIYLKRQIGRGYLAVEEAESLEQLIRSGRFIDAITLTRILG